MNKRESANGQDTVVVRLRDNNVFCTETCFVCSYPFTPGRVIAIASIDNGCGQFIGNVCEQCLNGGNEHSFYRHLVARAESLERQAVLFRDLAVREWVLPSRADIENA